MGEGITTLNFAIYDRWGEKVFSTKDPTIQWDGRYKGELLSSGVYAYKLYAVLADDTEYNQGGNITIVR
jgi:trimeric autotransporter adhesin